MYTAKDRTICGDESCHEMNYFDYRYSGTQAFSQDLKCGHSKCAKGPAQMKTKYKKNETIFFNK